MRRVQRCLFPRTLSSVTNGWQSHPLALNSSFRRAFRSFCAVVNVICLPPRLRSFGGSSCGTTIDLNMSSMSLRSLLNAGLFRTSAAKRYEYVVSCTDAIRLTPKLAIRQCLLLLIFGPRSCASWCLTVALLARMSLRGVMHTKSARPDHFISQPSVFNLKQIPHSVRDFGSRLPLRSRPQNASSYLRVFSRYAKQC